MTGPELYDFLCDMLDDYTNRYNPCDIKVVDGKAICMRDLEDCCNECDYLSPNGCTIRCLGCKLFVCFKLQKQDPVYKDVTSAAKVVAKKYGLIAMRTPKEELFKKDK